MQPFVAAFKANARVGACGLIDGSSGGLLNTHDSAQGRTVLCKFMAMDLAKRAAILLFAATAAIDQQYICCNLPAAQKFVCLHSIIIMQ
jgi:hypothetical protein